jgi:hypothetical protein
MKGFPDRDCQARGVRAAGTALSGREAFKCQVAGPRRRHPHPPATLPFLHPSPGLLTSGRGARSPAAPRVRPPRRQAGPVGEAGAALSSVAPGWPPHSSAYGLAARRTSCAFPTDTARGTAAGWALHFLAPPRGAPRDPAPRLGTLALIGFGEPQHTRSLAQRTPITRGRDSRRLRFP